MLYSHRVRVVTYVTSTALSEEQSFYMHMYRTCRFLEPSKVLVTIASIDQR
jgi:hypothetical protein